MTDTFEAKGKRKKLVAELRLKGITDEDVLRAIDSVPRHLFMDAAFFSHAYIDKAFPLTSGQTISQPYTVAVQSSLLKVKKRDKILEIGTGSGYQAAILAEMGAKVYTIERHKELFIKAKLSINFILPILKQIYCSSVLGIQDIFLSSNFAISCITRCVS